MKKTIKTPLLAVGTTLLSSFATAQAASPSFVITELESGYMQLAAAETKEETTKTKEGACGEGKCGGSMMQGSGEKTVEGNCAGNKPMPSTKDSEGKCGEGKCGEGKCGANKKK